MEDAAGVGAAQTEPEMPKEASAKGAVPAATAAQLSGRDSAWEMPDQVRLPVLLQILSRVVKSYLLMA